MNAVLSDLLKDVAPALATAALGPAGGLVVKAIAEKLGVANTVDAVSEAITNDPNAALKLAEIDVRQFELEIQDRSNSRDREVQIALSHEAPLINKIVTPVLALGTVAVSFGLLAAIMFIPDINGNRKDIAIYVLGAVNAATVQVLSYYFGAAHDHKKDVSPIILDNK